MSEKWLQSKICIVINNKSQGFKEYYFLHNSICFTSLLLENCDFLNTDISQGSVATRIGYGGVIKHDFVAKLLPSPPVKNVWKLVNIWWSYRQEFGVLFFDSHCRWGWRRYVFMLFVRLFVYALGRHCPIDRLAVDFWLNKCLGKNKSAKLLFANALFLRVGESGTSCCLSRNTDHVYSRCVWASSKVENVLEMILKAFSYWSWRFMSALTLYQVFCPDNYDQALHARSWSHSVVGPGQAFLVSIRNSFCPWDVEMFHPLKRWYLKIYQSTKSEISSFLPSVIEYGLPSF